MSSTVYTCGGCGWRGMGQRPRRFGPSEAPAACPRCGRGSFAASTENHPRVSCRCQDCGSEFIASQGSRFCAACRPNHQAAAAWRTGTRARRYVWTPEKDRYLRERYDSRIRNRVDAIARVFGYPRWQVKLRARTLGLTHPVDRRNFTSLEVAVIEEWTGLRSSTWIARKLKRTETSVILKQKRMGLSRRVRDGYTVRDLSECFGVDHHAVDRWIRENWLRAKRRGTRRAGKQGDVWKVQDDDIRRFIRHHPTAFRLDKCDQCWIIDLLLGAPIAQDAPARRRPCDDEVAA